MLLISFHLQPCLLPSVILFVTHTTTTPPIKLHMAQHARTCWYAFKNILAPFLHLVWLNTEPLRKFLVSVSVTVYDCCVTYLVRAFLYQQNLYF